MIQPYRRAVHAALLLLFVGLPFVRVGGESALRFDVRTLRLHVFGASLFINELFLVLAAVLGLTFLLLWLIAMSGGQSVALTDAFSKAGLKIPLLSQSSYKRLATFFNIIGGSYRNPFDISSSFFMSENSLSNLANMLDVMERDPNIDCIVLELFTIISPFRKGSDAPDPLLDTISEFKKRSNKPFITIVSTAHSETLALEVEAGRPRRVDPAPQLVRALSDAGKQGFGRLGRQRHHDRVG